MPTTQPLHSAALKGFVAIAKRLIEHGANVNVQTTQGTTDMYDGSPPVCGESPLHIATRHGHSEIVKVLLAHGARKDIPNHSGKTPRQWAQRYNQTEIEPLLAMTGSA